MSGGGVFQLIANDGKADKIIMASDLLKKRIHSIMCRKSKMGEEDPTPTLVDIEKTHILFMNAHYKPFAAFAYEYNKLSSSLAQFGGTVQYNIPQFGDFFCDMAVRVQLDKVSATTGTVPAFPAYIGSSEQSSSASASVSATENTTDGVFTKYIYEYVDIQGNVKDVDSAATNFVRYAEFPGQRLFKSIDFTVNGNPLDKYNADVMMFHQKFHVAPHKMTGWKRLVGQEVPVEAYSDLLSIEGSSKYGSALAGLTNVSGSAASGAPVNASVTARKLMSVVSGPQTPKAEQPALDLWIPLLFWFNKDPRLAVPSISIPYGQRFINIEIEKQENIVFTAPGNLFLRLTVEQYTSADAGTKGTASAIAVSDVKRWVSLTPVLASGSSVDTTQKINLMELYTNNIFVNSEIHDIYIHRIGFTLIRVHRLQTTRVSESDKEVQLQQLKWPIETIYLGLRPAVNVSATNTNQYRDWHRLTKLDDHQIDVTSSSSGDVMIDDTVAFNATSEKHKKLYAQELVEKVNFPVSTETIDSLEIKAHGIPLYHETKSQFFRDYMTYTFGGQNIITPEDPGAYMLNFCLYPGTYQPSGHINVSRAREFYLRYKSSYVNSSNPADLIIVASAINFLLVSDGSAIIRYST